MGAVRRYAEDELDPRGWRTERPLPVVAVLINIAALRRVALHAAHRRRSGQRGFSRKKAPKHYLADRVPISTAVVLTSIPVRRETVIGIAPVCDSEAFAGQSIGTGGRCLI